MRNFMFSENFEFLRILFVKKCENFRKKSKIVYFFHEILHRFFKIHYREILGKVCEKRKKIESFVRWKTSRYNITKDFDIEQSLSPRTNQLYSKCTIISIYYVNMTLERARIKTWRPYVNQTNLTNFNWDFLLIVL